MFWRLTQKMVPNTGMDDDVSAVFFEYSGT
jgi:sigma-B regulation protein RsbU (phosphoserine phosphatase)